MIIEKIKIEDLKPATHNPRKSDEKQEKHLKESLEKFGVVEPIIFNKQTGFIVGGHFRVRELTKLGYKEVDCVIVDLNSEEEKELNIRLNANTGAWDWDIIANEWDAEKIEEWGLDVPDFGEHEDYSDKNKEIDIDDLDTDMVLKLTYNEEEYNLVKDALLKIAPTPEQAICKLLNL